MVGTFMALLDITIVNVALPSIRTSLHASATSLVWLVSGYSLAYGLGLIPAGRAGDMFGHKIMFVLGLSIFTLASVACGISQTAAEIVVSRVVQGFGASLFFPAINATIQLSFQGPARSKAFGMLGAVVGVSTAIGPLLGGLIIAVAGPADGWRWVFLVNLFIGAVTVPLAAWQLPKSRSHTARGFDPAGMSLLTAALLLLLIPLVEGEQAGWPTWCWICLAACVVAFTLLGWWEVHYDRRGDDVLLKPGLIAQTSFSVGAIFTIVYFAGFSSIFFTLSILWQSGLGHSALITGLVIAPFSLGSLVTSSYSHRLSAALGRNVLVLGCSLQLAGLAAVVLILHLTAPSPSGWYLVWPLIVSGLGSGMTIAPNQDFVLAAIPRREAGTAAGTLATVQRVGTAVGIAVAGTVLFGTLHMRPGPDPAATAFSRSAQLALLVNVSLTAVALVLALAPRPILGRDLG
jgi:EmrB/QacA subfamily drug resistance transporter